MNPAKLALVDRDAPQALLDHMTVLADLLRCRILLLFERHELTVSELCAVVQLPQSTVSRHLKTLSDAGWIASRRDGTSRYYSIATDGLGAASERLWPMIREQVAGTVAAEQDERRLARVLAGRRSKSEQFFSTASGQWDHLRGELFGASFHLHAALALLDPSAAVGDLGCGTGQLAALVAPHVGRVIAVDGSPEMLQAARTRLAGLDNTDVRLGSLEALPLEDAQLDIAILALVLHHVPDPSRALGECARVVRRGGRALVIDMLPHDRAEYQQQMGHVWLGFAEDQMTKLLTGAGFTNVRLRPLPIDPEAKGPALFVAVATKHQ